MRQVNAYYKEINATLKNSALNIIKKPKKINKHKQIKNYYRPLAQLELLLVKHGPYPQETLPSY